MVNWPWSHPRMEVAHGKGYKVEEEAKGQIATSLSLTGDVIRVPHPANMPNYERWSNDSEASVALTVLTNIIAGVGYYTEMDEEYQPKKEGDSIHKNKVLVDNYGEDINLDEHLQTITEMMLGKGFCPVEIIESYDSQFDLKILPAETFYKYVDKKMNVVKYTQERDQRVITDWKTKAEIASILPFYFRASPSPLDDINRHYGRSLLEPIGPLLDDRGDMNSDMPRAVHRWAYPIPIMETSGSKAALQETCEKRDVDDWIFVGNVEEGEVRWKTLAIDPQARFIPYIELIYYQICEGLHAPLLLYLKNATEASATVMMESVDRLVRGIQRYIKRRVERFLFKPQTRDPVPRLVFGQPKTGLEEVSLTDVSNILPFLARNQQQHLLKQYIGALPEPDWREDAEINKALNPFPQAFPPANKPQPKTQKEPPLELLVEKLNDLQMGLDIIAQNFVEGRIAVAEACRLADRTIRAKMQLTYPGGWELKAQERFQRFVQECIMKHGAGDKPRYTVTVD